MAQGRLLSTVRRRARVLRLRRGLVWGAILFAAYTYLGGPHGFINYRKLKNEEQALLNRRRELTARAVDLEGQIARLRTDTLYIEQVARERYGFARPDERVYKIVTR